MAIVPAAGTALPSASGGRAAPPGAESSTSRSRSQPVSLPQAASRVWVPGPRKMPLASGPQPETCQALRASRRHRRVPEILSQTGRPSMRSSFEVQTEGILAPVASGVKRTPGRPISAMPTGMTIGFCVYQLMVVTWRTASIVKRIVLPESFGKRIGTLTTELGSFSVAHRRQRDELVAAGVGRDPDLGGNRVPPVGDDLQVEVVEGDAVG